MLSQYNEDQIYDALRSAETDMLDTKKYGFNRWRRNTGTPDPKGSSAYGPVMMTKGLIQDYLDRGKLSEKDFSNMYLGLMRSELIHGGNKSMAGYNPAFDYTTASDPNSGTGGMFMKAIPNFKANYEKTAKEIIKDKLSNAKTLEQVVSSWRGNTAYKTDPGYIKKVKAYLKANP